MTGTGIWAAVCVKSLGAAKQRLAPALAPDQRARLVLAMLQDVLAALAATPGLRGTLVISPDPDLLAFSAAAGARCIAQDTDIGFAPSADEAARAAAALGATGVMIVPADVPLALPADFHSVLAAHAGGMTIVPAWDNDGSNCVLLSPPAALAFCFGPGSFGRHLAAAAAATMPVRIVHNARLSQDIDTPADYATLTYAAGGPHLRRLLAASPTTPIALCPA